MFGLETAVTAQLAAALGGCGFVCSLPFLNKLLKKLG